MCRHLFVLAVFTIIYINASAQFGYGVQGTATYNLKSVSVGSKDYDLNPGPSLGYGVNAFYNIHQGIYRIALEANYMAATKASYPKPDSVNTEILVRGFNVSPGFQYAFKGSFDSAGQVLYAFAGVDINLYTYDVNGGNMTYEYDAFGYPVLNPVTAMPVYTNANYSYSKSYTAFTPNIGVGWEWGLNTHFHLFGQVKYSIGSKPSFNDIDQSDFTQKSMPTTYNPSYFSLNIGIRYWPNPKVWK